MVVKDGQNLGTMTVDAARNLAKSEGLDLVEVAANARPPVCRIMDFGKFKYELSIKEKSKQHKESVLKEIRMTPGIADNDIGVKMKAAQRFLEEGHKVQVKVMYKKREIPHKQLGYDVLEKFSKGLIEVGERKSPPSFSINNKGAILSATLTPKDKK